MAELRIKQVRSTSGTSPRQRDTLRSLKLGRIGKASTMTDTPQLQGQLRVVGHLVEVSNSTGARLQPGSGD